MTNPELVEEAIGRWGAAHIVVGIDAHDNMRRAPPADRLLHKLRIRHRRRPDDDATDAEGQKPLDIAELKAKFQ